MKRLEDQPKAMKAKRNRSERAQTTAEFVIVFPFMLLFFFLIVDFGWLLKNWIVVTNSAREAARCTVASSCSIDGVDSNPIALLVSRILDGGVATDPATIGKKAFYVDVDGNNKASAGDTVIICVKANNEYISPVIPFLSWLTGGSLPDPMPLAGREEMVLEFSPDSSYVLEKTTNAAIIANGKCTF